MPGSAFTVATPRPVWRPNWRPGARAGSVGGTAAALVAGVVATMAALALAVRLLHGGSISDSLNHAWVFVEVAAASVYAPVGALLVRRGGARLIGWIFIAVAACYAVAAFAAEYGSHGLYYAPGSLPAPGAVSSLQSWIWMPANVLLATLVPALLPDGRFRGPRWRLVGWGSALAVLLVLPAGVTNPWPWPMGPPASPFGVADVGWQRLAQGLSGAGLVLSGVLAPVALLSVVRNRRDVAASERPALSWLVAGSLAVVVPLLLTVSGAFTERFAAEAIHQLLQLVALPLLPTATLVAVLRHRLWGTELVVRRALVGAILTAAVVGVYAVAVILASWVVGGDGFLPSAAAAGAVALGFQPARRRIEQHVNRLLHGARHDPEAVVRRLGELLERPADPDATIAAMVRTLTTELQLGAVVLERVRHEDAEAMGSVGGPGSGERDVLVPLRSHGELVGRLRVSPIPGDRIDDRLAAALRTLAPSLASALQAAGLLRDLQATNERLVEAREEERRRLHRDLHDGLGPALAGVALAVQAADNRLASGRPDEARALLDVLVTEVERCVADVRLIVEGLRPPVLDELGLLGAVGEFVAWSAAAGAPVTLDASRPLAPLSAGVEVAAYHVVREAVTNVGRHARASTCVVGLHSDHDHLLRVDVIDDGCGMPEQTPRGVGLASLRERVVSTGGTFVVGPREGGGTHVRATWPAGA